MDVLNYHQVNQLEDRFPLGESIDLIGTPANGKYLPVDSFLNRSAYPELDALYPNTAFSFSHIIATLPYSANWRNIEYGGGLWVVQAYDSDKIATSSDGIIWEGTTLAATHLWFDIKYIDGIFYSVDKTDKIYYSTDGKVWNYYTVSVSNLSSIAYGNGIIVITTGGSTGNSVTSSDGINWTVNTNVLANGNWFVLAFGNGRFIAASYNTDYSAWSTDGVVWNSVTLPHVQNWTGLVYHEYNDTFILTGYMSSHTYVSYDFGANWSSYSNSWGWESNLIYGNGILLLLSHASQVRTSLDGITWVTQTEVPNIIYSGAAYHDGKFILAAGNPEDRAVIISTQYKAQLELVGQAGQHVRVK